MGLTDMGISDNSTVNLKTLENCLKKGNFWQEIERVRYPKEKLHWLCDLCARVTSQYLY